MRPKDDVVTTTTTPSLSQEGVVRDVTTTQATNPTAPHKFTVKSYGPWQFAMDVGTSVVIGGVAAIPISIIDHSIMAKVAGVSPSILHGIKEGTKTLLTKPAQFFIPRAANQRGIIYGAVGTVYTLTYLASDMTKSIMEAKGYSDTEIIWSRGLASGAVNTTMTMWKDGVILKCLPAAGAAAGPVVVPALSRLGFCVRDVATTMSAFTLVPMFSMYLNERYQQQSALQATTGLSLGNDKFSSLTVPAFLQLFTTVIHIGAIRYQRTYPNPSMLDITSSIKRDYIGTAAGRVARIVPAFGIGGIGNTYLLDKSQRWAEGVL